MAIVRAVRRKLEEVLGNFVSERSPRMQITGERGMWQSMMWVRWSVTRCQKCLIGEQCQIACKYVSDVFCVQCANVYVVKTHFM